MYYCGILLESKDTYFYLYMSLFTGLFLKFIKGKRILSPQTDKEKGILQIACTVLVLFDIN